MALVQDRKCVKPLISDNHINIIHKQQSLINQFQSLYYNSNNEIEHWDESNLPYIPTNGNNKDHINEKKAEAFQNTLYQSIGWELEKDPLSNRLYFKHPYSTLEYPVGWKYFGNQKVMIPQYIPEADSHEYSTNKKPNDKFSLPWYFSELTYDLKGNPYDFSDYDSSRKGKRENKKLLYRSKVYERKKQYNNNNL